MKCQVLITRGKNKGKLCYEVNKYCNTPNHKKKMVTSEAICQYCNKRFSYKTNVYRHEKEHCPYRPELVNIDINTESNVTNNNETINNISNTHNTSNNYHNITNSSNNNINSTINSNNNIQQLINIICVRSNDDFNKILSEKMGEVEAQNYILECAKNNLEGDINLLKKIYFDEKKEIEYPIKFLDRSRNKVEFIDENMEKVIDPRGIELGKRICGNLQNGYLLHVNRILEANLNQQNDGKFLDEFDLLNCQNHIYELSSKKYRRMLLSAIPSRI